MYGEVLMGKEYEYYGRCVCPEGEYKFAFGSDECNKTEYIEEAYAEFWGTVDEVSEVSDLFANRAFMIVELGEK